MSAILNLGQKVAAEWPLIIMDHEGGAHEVYLRPGDMVWYESRRYGTLLKECVTLTNNCLSH